MKTPARSLLAAIAAVALTVAGFHTVQRGRAQEAARLRRANHQLRLQAHQRVLTAAHQAEAGVDVMARTPPGKGASPMSAGPAGADYRNEGRATALAALQTFAWACDRGDTAALAAMITFEGSARRKAEAYLATLPATSGSPEEMAAALLADANMKAPFPGTRILETASTEPNGDDRVMVRLPGTGKDRLEFQKTGSGWNYLITEKAVDNYLARNRPPPAPAVP